MSTHLLTCQFMRDSGSEHLASTRVQADAEAVLFSWTDQEGRGYQVLLREGDRLVASLRFDDHERVAATEELDMQCRALGLTWEAAANVADAVWIPPSPGAGGELPNGLFAPGVVHHGH